jgi:hypothetical protein
MDTKNKKSLSITLPQSIYIILTEEDKILWDFMLADTQRKLKKTLTEREFLSLLMESYQKTTLDDVDDVDEKPEEAFFMNAKTARKMMQRVIDGGGQAFEKGARASLLNAQKYDGSRTPYDGTTAPKDFKPNLRPILLNESKHNQYTNTTPYIPPQLQDMVCEAERLAKDIEAIMAKPTTTYFENAQESYTITSIPCNCDSCNVKLLEFVKDMTKRMSEKSNALEANFKREK